MPKALVEYEGSLLVERAVRTARAVCDPVLVVLGAQAFDVWRQAGLTRAAGLAGRRWGGGPGRGHGTRWPSPPTTASAATRCCSAGTTGRASRPPRPATRAPA